MVSGTEESSVTFVGIRKEGKKGGREGGRKLLSLKTTDVVQISHLTNEETETLS